MAKRRWNLLVFAVVLATLVGFLEGGFVELVLMIREEHGLADAAVAAVLTAGTGSVVYVAAVSGVASRAASDRVVVGAALAVAALGQLLITLGSSESILRAGRFLIGAGSVVLTVYLFKIVADRFVSSELFTAMAALVAAGSIGGWLGKIRSSIAGSVGLAADRWLTTALVVVLLAWVLRSDRVADTKSGGGLPSAEVVVVLALGVASALVSGAMVATAAVGASKGLQSLDPVIWAFALSAVVGGIVIDRSGRPGLVVAASGGLAVLGLAGLGRADLGDALAPYVVVAAGVGLVAGLFPAVAARALSAPVRAVGLGLFVAAAAFTSRRIGDHLTEVLIEEGTDSAAIRSAIGVVIGLVLVGAVMYLRDRSPAEIPAA